MYCSNCKKEISNEYSFCPHCGTRLISDSNDIEIPVSTPVTTTIEPAFVKAQEKPVSKSYHQKNKSHLFVPTFAIIIIGILLCISIFLAPIVSSEIAPFLLFGNDKVVFELINDVIDEISIADVRVVSGSISANNNRAWLILSSSSPYVTSTVGYYISQDDDGDTEIRQVSVGTSLYNNSAYTQRDNFNISRINRALAAKYSFS